MNKVALVHPAAITTCNLDLEGLITDTNRSVATLAITTLLKTVAKSSVERLMKQIATFVAEISDEFKVVIVQAIRALCTKFPRKHSVLINFDGMDQLNNNNQPNAANANTAAAAAANANTQNNNNPNNLFNARKLEKFKYIAPLFLAHLS